MKETELKTKDVPGLISTLKAVAYKSSMIYLRRIQGLVDQNVIYEYIVTFKNEVYTSYVIVKLKEGQKKITNKEENGAAGVVFAGACTTIDTLLETEAEMAKNGSAKGN